MIRKLVNEFDSRRRVPSHLSVRIEAKPRLDMVLLSLGSIVCVVLSSPEMLSFKRRDKISQRLDRRCYRDQHCTTEVKRLWNFSVPFQRYMHDTMEQKELEPTSATSQIHTWAIRLLNLQLFSHPQQPQQNDLQHHSLFIRISSSRMTCPTTVFMGHLSTWVSCTLAARFRTHHSQDVISTSLCRIISRP